jgi:pimeloyl-ACP methyl ester carboxylesterase
MPFSAGLDDVVFYSHGCKLLGGFYRAQGETPRPTAILLHGVPGVEQNLDIAYALRDAGWNCLYFHYRGSWGSQGSYSFAGQREDIQSAKEWLLGQPSVDPQQLALVGSSMGGYMTLAAGASDPSLKALVTICPLVDPSITAIPIELFTEWANMLHSVNGEELKRQWYALPPIQSMADQLARRDVLLVSGEQDELFPPAHHLPLVERLPGITWQCLVGADHAFSQHRRELVHAVIVWLTNAENRPKVEFADG